METKKLTKNELEDIAGGVEPEEFDWNPKGYVTPEHTLPENDDIWKFTAIGDDKDPNIKDK